MRIYIALFGLLIASLGLVAPSLADGIIIVDPPPDVQVDLDEALAIKYHHVEVEIKDQVATTRVDQVFVNKNPWEAKGTYIFPLPAGAAVSDFVMWADGQEVHGEILEAGEARVLFDQIVREMRDPALLEYVGRDLLKASVYPIPAGGERRIQLEYGQVLPVDDGLVRYVYPLSTEKYSSEPLEELTVSVDVVSPQPIKAVYSPSHDVAVERVDGHSAVASLEENDVLPDRDFELYYTVSQDKVGLNLLCYKEQGEDGFFLLLAAPDVKVSEEEVVAKDVILVLDVSGSMEGEKLDQAMGAAKYVLGHLNPEDRFDVVAFSTGLKTFSPTLEPSTEAGRGTGFVERLEAMGMTDINRALLEAMAMTDPDRPTTLIFLTDGQATKGVKDTSDILKNVDEGAPDNVRIFAFGVGDDVDTDLLDQLSLDHGGTSTYVRRGQGIDEAVSAFYSKVSKPVLSNLEIDFGDVDADRLFPVRVPDLFAGSQLVLVGRYAEGKTSTITLSGEVNDRSVSYVYPGVNFTSKGGDDFIPRLWATRAIGHYLTQIRLYGEEQEMVDSIVALSIRYGIITPYTSFLIQEDEEEDDGKDIFSEEGKRQIAEEVQVEMAAESAEPAAGTSAVQKAAFQGALSSAQAPMAIPTMMAGGGYPGEDGTAGAGKKGEEVIKHVGSKTFVFKNMTWTDTSYDRDMEVTEVPFLSMEYFDLLEDHPGLGKYFALGEKVIVVYEKVAYMVGGNGSGNGSNNTP